LTNSGPVTLLEDIVHAGYMVLITGYPVVIVMSVIIMQASVVVSAEAI